MPRRAAPTTTCRPAAAALLSRRRPKQTRRGWLPAALAVITAAALIAPGPGSAGPGTRITQAAVSDVTLGSPLDIAYDLFGNAPVRDRLEGGWVRYSFRQAEVASRRGELVEVYLRSVSRRIAAIVVTDRRWRTVAGVGPCSSLAALRRAYPRKLVPIRQSGGVVAYRLGSLFFAVDDGPRVSAVQLSAPSVGPWLATNAPACGTMD